MGSRNKQRATFEKRQRERARQERQAEKRARRQGKPLPEDALAPSWNPLTEPPMSESVLHEPAPTEPSGAEAPSTTDAS